MDYAFDFIIGNGGINTEDDYPYAGVEGQCDPTKVPIPSLLIVKYYDLDMPSTCLIALTAEECQGSED